MATNRPLGSPANESSVSAPPANTTPSANDTSPVKLRMTQIDSTLNTVLYSNMADSIASNPKITQELFQGMKHILLSLKEEGCYSKAAITQAIAKSSLGLTSGTDESLLKEAKREDDRRIREHERAHAREKERQAREERHQAYLQREAARQQRAAAQRKARGRVGYDVQGGVTKIGRNYM